MDEDFLHLFEESPALRLMRGRLGSFVVGFFFKTFKKWGTSEASEEELIATLSEHIEHVREIQTKVHQKFDFKIKDKSKL